jgi:hypothetical protein
VKTRSGALARGGAAYLLGKFGVKARPLSYRNREHGAEAVDHIRHEYSRDMVRLVSYEAILNLLEMLKPTLTKYASDLVLS